MPYKNPDDAKANRVKRREVIKNQANRCHLNKLGWSEERYNIFFYAQGGLCYVCGESNYSRGNFKRLDADHSHETNLPRGLLCNPCNQLLGRIEANLVRLPTIMNYLNR